MKNKNESLESWVENWAQENGSAVEIWGNYPLWARLRSVVESGAEVKSVGVPHSVSEDWTILAEEQNYDAYEAIVYRQ